MNIIVEITLDVLHNIAYFVKNNLVRFANVINVILPFMMFHIGQDIALGKGEFTLISPVLIIPLFVFMLIFYLKSIANKIGKGITIPVPDKRFTEVDDDGEVSIENRRIQELLLYVADLEDWLEKKGML